MARVGAQIADDRFTEAWCYFDCLDVWAQPPSLTTRAGETRGQAMMHT
jgi:hypothetical protein